ncbi:TetR/AcrR family transcriptional regulator [Cytobacillus massiliigabonensis]|uniref:TetR/AcrR family transcriptional regulator n=1 Tax=Cytobacillus massiliigabonensis TaxID=1871011 RepID=UPI000C81E925|nr:TetR/AcrR family transcriptional regulator [Cytobacillus massiliigabonensis]
MPPIVSEEYKQKKKREILDSALDCFAKKGFQVATMDDIVKRSGISKGAIYNYFKSKDEIYLELMREQTETSNARLREKLSNFKSAKEKLIYLFGIYKAMDPYEEDRRKIIIVHLEFTLYSSRSEEINKILKERGHKFFIQLIIEIIEEGQRLGEFRQDAELQVIANMFWTVMDGAMLHTIINNEYPYTNVLENYQNMILRFLEC